MPRKRSTKKQPRPREYTGPSTLEAVKEFMLSNATKKAKDQAAETLSKEDQLELMKWAIQRLSTEMDRFQKNMEIERKRQGF